MSAGETLYKGMFTGHVSLHLHCNSCPKTQNMHALHCHRFLCVGPYIVAENQLRPCGQRRPDSWVNLSLFISIMWVEDSKGQPLTCDSQHCELHCWSHLKVDLNQLLLLNHSSSDRQIMVPAQFQLPLAAVQWTMQAFFTCFISKSSWQRSCLKGSAFEHAARTARPRNICDSHIHLCSDSSTDTWVIVSKTDVVGKAISRRKWKIKVQTSWFLVMPECCAFSVMQLKREAGLSWVRRLMASDTFCSDKSFNSHRLWASLYSSLYEICRTGTVSLAFVITLFYWVPYLG